MSAVSSSRGVSTARFGLRLVLKTPMSVPATAAPPRSSGLCKDMGELSPLQGATHGANTASVAELGGSAWLSGQEGRDLGPCWVWERCWWDSDDFLSPWSWHPLPMPCSSPQAQCSRHAQLQAGEDSPTHCPQCHPPKRAVIPFN